MFFSCHWFSLNDQSWFCKHSSVQIQLCGNSSLWGANRPCQRTVGFPTKGVFSELRFGGDPCQSDSLAHAYVHVCGCEHNCVKMCGNVKNLPSVGTLLVPVLPRAVLHGRASFFFNFCKDCPPFGPKAGQGA